MADAKLKLTIIVSELFAENTYIAQLEGRGDCLIVDPGLEPEKILAHLESAELQPAALLNTHGHSDHIAGNATLKDRWPDCPVVIGRLDAPKLTDPNLNLSAPFGLPLASPPADVLVDDGNIYRAAGFELEVRHTPGHSVGHVVFVWKGDSPWRVFCGDVLFAGGIGRTDFSDGSFPQLAASIHKKLFTLPEDTIVLSGHGEATTIGREKSYNPWVGKVAR